MFVTYTIIVILKIVSESIVRYAQAETGDENVIMHCFISLIVKPKFRVNEYEPQKSFFHISTLF